MASGDDLAEELEAFLPRSIRRRRPGVGPFAPDCQPHPRVSRTPAAPETLGPMPSEGFTHTRRAGNPRIDAIRGFHAHPPRRKPSGRCHPRVSRTPAAPETLRSMPSEGFTRTRRAGNPPVDAIRGFHARITQHRAGIGNQRSRRAKSCSVIQCRPTALVAAHFSTRRSPVGSSAVTCPNSAGVGPMRSAWTRSLARSNPKTSAATEADHPARLVDRDVVERLLQPLTRVRPRALGVREVVAPEDVVDADLVAHAELAALGVGRADEAVAVDVLATAASTPRRGTDRRRASRCPSGRGTAGPRTTAARAATSSRPR